MTETRCPLPKMARIRQTFARPRVDDVAVEMREQMQVLTPRIRPGMTVGLTVGSRGIQNILTMLEVAVQAVRGCGASPVLLAAMGSHGGGTRQGQKDVLDSLGITEERLGAPVITCDVTRAIGETPGGLVAYMLESSFFHAVNGGSNPPGDAKNFNRLQQLSFWVTKIGLQFFLRRLSLEEFLF